MLKPGVSLCSLQPNQASCTSGKPKDSCCWVAEQTLFQTGGSCTQVNKSTDPLNCGLCGHSCSAPPPNAYATCTAGQCGFQCQAGFVTCGDACLAVNSTTCGSNCVNFQACNATCSSFQACQTPTNAVPTATCAAGQCGFECVNGYAKCGGDCLNTALVKPCDSVAGDSLWRTCAAIDGNCRLIGEL